MFSDLRWQVNILQTEVSIYHIVKRIIGLLWVQWFEVRGEHPTLQYDIYLLLFIGCSPLTSNHWTHKRQIMRFTIWYILTSVCRMFTSHIIGLLCVQWFEVRGEHPKNRSKYISYCKTYYWSFMCSVIWGERWTSYKQK
jgi:hypothetical protein